LKTLCDEIHKVSKDVEVITLVLNHEGKLEEIDTTKEEKIEPIIEEGEKSNWLFCVESNK